MQITTVTAAKAFRPTGPTRLSSRSEERHPRRGEHGPSPRHQVRFVVAGTASA